jgi:hypothetical protein
MGLMDKVKEMFGGSKAKDLAAEHGDQVVKGVDKATDVVDDKTKGKYSEQVEKADEGAAKIVDKLDGEQ